MESEAVSRENETRDSSTMAEGVEISIPNSGPDLNDTPNRCDSQNVSNSATLNAFPASKMMKKRGRPKKYRPEGSFGSAISPDPISSFIPFTGDFSSWKHSNVLPFRSAHNHQGYEPQGDKIAYFVGSNFTPHIITVNAGEDVTMKVMSFSQQGIHAICILSANGMISNVILRQPTSSGGTLTYEGIFEILSLSGSFMPTESGVTKSQSGGMSVSLAGPDGRVFGGGLAGLLIAAGPVQVVVASFVPGHRQEQKHKKQKLDAVPSPTVAPFPSDHRDEQCHGLSPGFPPAPPLHVEARPPANHVQSDATTTSSRPLEDGHEGSVPLKREVTC